MYSADGGRYKLSWPVDPEAGPEPEKVPDVFVFLRSTIICQLYKLKLSDQAQVSAQLRVGLYDLS